MTVYASGSTDKISFHQRAWSDVMVAAARDLVDIEAGVSWDESTVDRISYMTQDHMALAVRIIAGMAQDLGYTPEELRWEACRPEIDDAFDIDAGAS